MAWDEQRRMRAARAGDTAEIEAVPVGGGPAPAASAERAPPPGPRARVEGWGRRFGWTAAVGLSVIALILAALAFASAGTTTVGNVGPGRRYLLPYGGHGVPYRHVGGLGPGFGQPQ
jgi:hypothetical protein